MAGEREYLIEMTVCTDGAGTTSTLCYSVFGFNSEPYDTLPNRHYAPRVIRPGVLSMTLFSPGATTGQSKVGFGGVQLANVDGGLDGLIDYGFAGCPIRVLTGDRGALYSTFTVLLTGVMDQPVFSWDTVSIAVRDRQNLLAQKKVQTTVYAGTNSGSPLTGAEGTAANLKGKRKPIIYGTVQNVTAECVNTDRNIYQISDGAVQTISAVYVAGVAKTVGTVYPDYATMESTAPAGGSFRALPSLGLFRLDANTSSQVTADASQGATAANRTAAQIISALAQRAGLTGSDISAADIAALDAVCAQELGLFIPGDTDMMTTAAMDVVASSVGAWYGFDLTGLMRVGRVQIPTGTPVASFDTTTILSISRRISSNEGAGVPAWRVNVLYQPNSTVQSAGLGAVTALRLGYIVDPALKVTAEDTTVKNQYPLAVEMTFSTTMVSATDAANEAARLLALYKTRRDTLSISVRLTPALARALVLGSTISVTVPRYGLSAGKLFTVIGYAADYERDTVDLTIWG